MKAFLRTESEKGYKGLATIVIDLWVYQKYLKITRP